MCFASGGGGLASNPMYRTRGPLTATEEEQRRSQSSAWASRDRGGAMDPFKLMPSSRQAKLSDPMNRQAYRNYQIGAARQEMAASSPFGVAPKAARGGIFAGGLAERNNPELAQQRLESAQQANLASYKLPEKPKMKLGMKRG